MTKFEKITATILSIALCIALVGLGFYMGKSNHSYNYYEQYNEALAQRDRLADYLHIYMDMQAENDSTTLNEFVSSMEKEDSYDKHCPPMSSTDWCFAY